MDTPRYLESPRHLLTHAADMLLAYGKPQQPQQTRLQVTATPCSRAAYLKELTIVGRIMKIP